MFARLDVPLAGFLASVLCVFLFAYDGLPGYAYLLAVPPLLICGLALVGRRFGSVLLIWAMNKLAERSV